MITAYIAVGSNLADPVSQANLAIETLKSLPQSKFIATSKLYSSTPMGPQNQPDYINAVVAIETELTPIELLNCTQAIEQEQGRVRKDERWGPRTLDLDIILYGNEVIDSERLTVPHYGMKEREFVLYPLAEIAPSLQLPDGTELSELLKVVDKNGLNVWQK
ncbi:2-amino-4-hydroxy-6-hydroxymethyldihydropteridine diphosphokinase [Vibrio fortis]|jgi:2-amino-4-hydroxy-6-hydroxymethyldihydropteridine diphosphokinase|uniref:2-amino-4-hydroxy-6-hydroxymethyldihydropteridine pyrophosphokinase n=2 Tax=Vibrio TaxID=662 RepID=A0A066UKT5_9VIBR|nr:MULTISPECIES: 2-amino-4-hydroxy-6-hydroxymethyldihydropteridine diphosphokinase [Vibrio]KAB0302808.1 2-amino-4-hydroxy-6-hydroxymethyldihydropteridine diphosphokinase [Vibrio fortis]KDN28051.1 2-amino-4-hydroxy-6-hydroxymethyldihydropteridine pyrophosphokinase [Vibrio fortis]MCG9631427.1 2-amino-4-hydroxy-6-hydroxymethyldihydropteridine diphosphokinase [Vibrio sp. Isolate30]MDK9762566.1 2-amino-4-hydroxy-6-hydroxymethyldihydropteridine diphosphokinase [Vibrio sp. D420a]QFT10738.1 2-amino-4-|tara:strand:- start:557 stop:1042 length:486 start_codon:yes stop_codon:yes gene_type:complete